MIQKFLASAALALACTQAPAAILLGTQTTGATTVADYSADGLISFDIDFADTQPVTLRYELTAGDLGGPLSLEAILRNITGTAFNQLFIALEGSSFDSVGSVTRLFAGGTSLSATDHSAVLRFDSPEYLDVELGDVYGSAGHQDWRLSTAGLRAGDTLSLRFDVPEPQSLALLLAALGLLGWTTARGRAGRR